MGRTKKEFAEVVTNCDHLQNLKFRSTQPYVFTLKILTIKFQKKREQRTLLSVLFSAYEI